MVPTLILLGCNFGQMYLVALGFSESFYDLVTNFGYRRELFDQPLLWFFVVSIVPALVYCFLLISNLKIAPVTPGETDKPKSEHKRKRLDL